MDATADGVAPSIALSCGKCCKGQKAFAVVVQGGGRECCALVGGGGIVWASAGHGEVVMSTASAVTAAVIVVAEGRKVLRLLRVLQGECLELFQYD
jgi:hypothetical protein